MGYLRVHVWVLPGLLRGWAKHTKPENKKQQGLLGSQKCRIYTGAGLWTSAELSRRNPGATR